jgi:hypothetical protein
MISSSLNRLTFVIFISAFLLGCSSTAISAETLDEASESEFNRTTSCVNGGLPMEVQFVLPDNPPKLGGPTFGLREVDSIANRVDGKVAGLLEEAALRAWKTTSSDHKPDWSAKFVSRLELELMGEITSQAPRRLQLEFCGDRESVGSTVLAAIAAYLSRTVQLDGARQPDWLRNLGPNAADRSTSIIMLAVALRLAKIEFDPKILAQAIDEF